MSYSSLDNIKARISEEELIRLTDDNEAVVDSIKVDDAIASADAEIDSYLAKGDQYSVPLTEVPVLIRSFSVDIAIYTLYSLDEAHAIPEPRKERYEQAIAALKAIADGEQSLGVNTTAAAGTDTIELVSQGRVFSRDKLRSW